MISEARMPLLEVNNLYVGYHTDLHILKGVRLALADGKITTVLGANGVGKSTLLKAIFGFLQPSMGTIDYAGSSLVGVQPHEMIERGISYIAQQPGIFDEMSVEENLLMGAWSFRHHKARVKDRLEQNYETFPQLFYRRRQKGGELSGGQQRMVEVGRILMMDPQLILVDEPTAGLSRVVSEQVYRMLEGLRAQGKTILLVDQEIRQALQSADYVYVLALGENRFEGPASDFVDLEKAFWL